MKKPIQPIEKSTAKPSTQLPAVNGDKPIIHHNDPEIYGEQNSYVDLPEKINAEYSETLDISAVVSFKELKVSSSAFRNNEPIPSKYTCDGSNVNPPLDVENTPAEAKCLALIVDDPDAPGKTFVHWVVWNIPVTHHIKENEIHGVQGINDFKKSQYMGPCPPPGLHHYFFKVYALDALLNVKPGSSKQVVEKAMSQHIIGFGQLTGTYQRAR